MPRLRLSDKVETRTKKGGRKGRPRQGEGMKVKPGKNKFCKLDNLRNESDVEQFLVSPLLSDLGYGEDYLETKGSIESVSIGKGRKKRDYAPDYLGYAVRSRVKPVLVVDAKHPDKSAEVGVEEAQLYASTIRRRMAEPKPEQYCVASASTGIE